MQRHRRKFGIKVKPKWCQTGGYGAQFFYNGASNRQGADAHCLTDSDPLGQARKQDPAGKAVLLREGVDIGSEGTAAAKAPQQGLLHEVKQPLNVIRLATDNIRVRILPLLDQSDGEYLKAKLDRIERQVLKAVELTERAPQPLQPLNTVPADTPPPQ